MPTTDAPHRVKVVVIADDLTGAAELAGAALSFGLSAEIVTGDYRRSLARTRSDVVCIDTDSRSLDPAAAADAAADATRSALGAFDPDGQVDCSSPPWLYKKCDSVLRGNVLAEIEAIRRAAGFKCTLLIPANPGKSRCIRGGKYLINGLPLDATSFRDDPEYPRLTADVLELLGVRSGELETVLIPDVASGSDVDFNAVLCEGYELEAGAVEFFEALLENRFGNSASVAVPELEPETEQPSKGGDRKPSLVVCGSAAAWASGRQQQCEAAGGHVTTMPSSLAVAHPAPAALRNWGDEIAHHLAAGKTVLAAVGQPEAMARDGGPPPAALATNLAVACAWALGQARSPAVRAIYAEGGATAAALTRAAGWHHFIARRTLAPGVAELEPVPHPAGSQTAALTPAPPLVVKVGSYPWPDGVW